MGQNQQKDVKNSGPVKRAVVPGRGGVRPAAMNDALVQPQQRQTSHHVNPNAGTATDNSSSPAAATQHSTTATAQNPPATVPSTDDNKSATADVPSNKPAVQQTPVVIRYRDPQDLPRLFEQKKEITVLFRPANTGNGTPVSAWTSRTMTRSDDNFYAIAELSPGEHEFRFQVDGQLRVDASQATQKALEGDLVNCMFVNPLLLTTGDDDDVVDDGEGWGKEMPKWEETRKYPPQLPAHLRYTPLNTPPTQIRCVDGELSNNSTQLDSEHLPLPLSVTINHVYFQRRSDHVVVGLTSRYNNKYTTVAYYKSLPPVVVAQGAIPTGAIPVGGNRDV